jgi:hypothetical protein
MRNYQDEMKKHLLLFITAEKAELVDLHSNVLLRYIINRIGDDLHKEDYTERHVRRIIRTLAERLGLRIDGKLITEVKK